MMQNRKITVKCPFTKDTCLGEQCAVFYVNEKIASRQGWCALRDVGHVAANLQSIVAALHVPRTR